MTNLDHETENLRQRAATGVFWSGLHSGGRQVISLVVFLVLARLLEPRQFGQIALAGVFLAFIQIFLDQGFADAIVQRANVEKAHLDSAFWATIGVAFVLIAVAVSSAGLVAAAFGEPVLAPVIQVLSASFLLGALASVQTAILRRRLLIKGLAARSLVAAVVGGVVGVAMAFLGFGVWSLVGQQLAGSAAAVIVLWRVSEWRPGVEVSRRHLGELWSFGINIVGINFVNFFNRRSGDLLIGYFLGPVALGYYSVGYRVLRLVSRLVTTISGEVVFPTFSRLRADPERLRAAFYTATQLTGLVSIPVFVSIAVLAPGLVPVLFGDQWAPSIPVMQILAFIGILQSVFFFNRAVIMASGRPGWALALTAVSGVANVVAFSIAVHWGIVAVAAAFVIRAYVLSPLPILAVRRLIGLSLRRYLAQYYAAGLGAAVMAALMLSIQQVSDEAALEWLVVGAIAGGAAYVATIRLFAPRAFGQAMDIGKLALPHLRSRGVRA
jgi:O-antigen/teichoic acid export membrane protein